MKSKKATYFTPMIVVAVLIFLGVAFTTLSGKIHSKEELGTKEMTILNAYNRGEFAALYTEQSGMLSSLQSLADLAFNGGYSNESNCGAYFGFNSWTLERNKKTTECYPSQDDLASNFGVYEDVNLGFFLQRYTDAALPQEFDYTIFQNPFEIIGSALSSAQLGVYPKPTAAAPSYYAYNVPASEKEIVQKIIQTYQQQIEAAAKANNVPDTLLVAIIAQESKGNPNAISPTGCAGLAQFCYSTANDSRLGGIFSSIIVCCPSGVQCPQQAKCNAGNDDRFDASKSISAEARYLSIILKDFSGYDASVEFTAASYNGGEGVVKNAIAHTNINNPSWTDVSLQLTPESITYFTNYGDQVKKVREINKYVARVMAYKSAAEQLLAAPTAPPAVS